MAIALAVVLVVHGLIHLLGVAKALGLADLPALTLPIAPVMGGVWLMAALLCLMTAVALYAWPQWWWVVGAAAVVVSTVAIVPSWADARFGMIPNAIVLVAVIVGFATHGPFSLEAAYAREVAQGDARALAPAVVTEADLVPLPALVQGYLRGAGVVGRPRVTHLYVRMHGRFRNGADAPWMPFAAEQHNAFDEPSRFFYMTAMRGPIPMQAFHRYAGASASMRVKVAGLATVIDVAGAEMTRAETVTLFNDMCLLAPATLISPAITWEGEEGRTVRAAFTNAGHTIRAVLTFGETGDLADFRSEDRQQASPDGSTLTRMPWTTPVSDYGTFGPFRLAARGEARWHPAAGAFAYIEFELDEVAYNRP
ncbi:MAG: hypothetical protein Q8L86_11070 [Vicinamibacterales bacterium]|nr:hypothetical protein [Vicinamibacterales bacterium]